jgi:hypothetical protein
MPDLAVYTQSVEWIWLIWLASLVIVVAFSWFAFRHLNLAALVRLWREEDGAAYSLAYALTLPFYVMFVCVVLETTAILIVKIGTVQAAYAAARSHIAYGSLVPPDVAREKARRAAVQAMVPFASGSWQHADGTPSNSALTGANHYKQAINKYDSNLPAKDWLLERKYFYADKATSIDEIRKDKINEPNGLVEVTILYKVPIFVPGVGRILGGRDSPWGGNYYVLDMYTTVALPDEAPHPPMPGLVPNRPKGPLGIEYAVPQN